MRTKIRPYILILFIFIANIISAQWTNVNSINSNSTVMFNASKVLQNNTIYLIGDDGIDLFNRDGVIYKSVDNGLSFTKTNTLTKAFQLSRITFSDTNTGYIFGQTKYSKGFVARTVNGGQTWISDSIPGTTHLKANSFINNSSGYVADFQNENLRIFKTIDAGISWNLVCNKDYSTGPVNDMQFITENLGFLCTQTFIAGMQYATIMRTVDGGVTWQKLRTVLYEDYTALHFFDYYNGLVLTYSGNIYKTSDAGRTWTQVRFSSTLQNCTELKFINPQVGYVIGVDSILKTTDAGNTWQKVHNISTLSLFGYNTVDVNQNGIGIAAGGVGSFYSYSTNFGGASVSNTMSSAYISGYDSVCNGQNASIRFDFTGIPPWSVIYGNGTNTYSLSNITSSPLYVTIPTSGIRQVFSINSFSANGISSANYYGKAIVTTIPPLTASSLISGDTSLCLYDSARLTIKLKGIIPFSFTYSDGTSSIAISNYKDSVFSVYVKPTATTTYHVTSMQDRCGNIGVNNGSATITVNSPPTAPMNLTTETTNYNRIKLTWIDMANNEDSIVVERRIDSVQIFSRIAALPPNTMLFVDSTAIVNYTYYYRLKYYKAARCITYSNTVNYKTEQLFRVVKFKRCCRLYDIYHNSIYNHWYDWDGDGDLDNINEKLYLNMGNDSFSVVNDSILNTLLEKSVRIYDADNDGKPDIFAIVKVGQDYFGDLYKVKFFKNIGSNVFVVVDSVLSNFDTIRDPERENIIIADLNGDGKNETLTNDVYVNNTYLRNIDTVLSKYYISNNNLVEIRRGTKSCYNPNELFPPGQLYSVYGISPFYSLFDLDNNGYLDILLRSNNLSNNTILYNSHDISSTQRTKVASDYDSYADDDYVGFADFDNDGYLDAVSSKWLTPFHSPGYAETYLLLNNKNGILKYFDIGYRNMLKDNFALADYNNDGKIDVSTNQDILKNNIINNNKWIKINCKGTVSAKIPYGTKIKIKTTVNGISMWQTRNLSTNTNYHANDNTTIHFGLGLATVIDSIKVIWPSGIIWDSTNITPNFTLNITEPHLVFPKILENPSSLRSTGNTISEVNLQWCIALNAETYTVQRKLSGQPNYTNIALMPSDSFRYTDTSLLPGTIYNYRILANGHGQSTYSNELTTITGNLNIYINNFDTVSYSMNNAIFFNPSRSKTLKYHIYYKINSGNYSRLATINALKDTFTYHPFYIAQNLPQNSRVCFYLVAYYPQDSLSTSASNVACISVRDYCTMQKGKYRILSSESASGQNISSLEAAPCLCSPIQLEATNINSSYFGDMLFSAKWYFNDVPLTNSILYHLYPLNDSSKAGYYQVVVNENSICPDTTAKFQVKFDGNGFNKVSFDFLNTIPIKNSLTEDSINYVCKAEDTIYLKVNSTYQIYDSINLRDNYMNTLYDTARRIYRVFLRNPNYTVNFPFVNNITLFDKYLSYCSISSNNQKLSFTGPDEPHFLDSAACNADLMLATQKFNPLIQYRKHTNDYWGNLYLSQTISSGEIVSVCNRSGYYRVIDTLCNDTSKELIGLRAEGFMVVEGLLVDSIGNIMRNVPYELKRIWMNGSTPEVYNTYLGTTDNNGRIIIDSLNNSSNYKFLISFTKNGKVKSFTDTIIVNTAQNLCGNNYSSVQLVKFVFRFNNPIVGIQQHIALIDNLNIFPNPATNNVTVKFSIKESTKLSIGILNSIGQQIMELENGKLVSSGIYDASYQLRLSKGLYFIRIRCNGEEEIQKLIIN